VTNTPASVHKVWQRHIWINYKLLLFICANFFRIRGIHFKVLLWPTTHSGCCVISDCSILHW